MGKPSFQIKGFSRINEKSEIQNAVGIALDDMVDSGGTADIGMGYLNDREWIKQGEIWCSHILAPNREKIKGLKHINKIVALDTILHDNPEEMNLEYIEASADLLAAELFKAHSRLEEERFSS